MSAAGLWNSAREPAVNFDLEKKRAERIAAIAKQIEDLSKRIRTELERSCIECDHFSAGHCAKWNTTPPDAWLDYGCDEFIQGIPF